MLPDGEVVPVEFSDFCEKVSDEFAAEAAEWLCLVFVTLEFVGHFGLKAEDAFLYCWDYGGFFSMGVDAEEFEVCTVVEDVEFFFVCTVDEFWAEACSATDHLPEFCFAEDFFEEDEVDDFRDVDAGVKHVNRDCDSGISVWFFKFVYEAVCVVCVVVDDTYVVRRVTWVFFAEDFIDFFGVCVVFGEDDGFSNFASVVCFYAVFEEGCEYFFDGVCVEDPVVECGAVDRFWEVSVFVEEEVFVFFFFFG